MKTKSPSTPRHVQSVAYLAPVSSCRRVDLWLLSESTLLLVGVASLRLVNYTPVGALPVDNGSVPTQGLAAAAAAVRDFLALFPPEAVADARDVYAQVPLPLPPSPPPRDKASDLNNVLALHCR